MAEGNSAAGKASSPYHINVSSNKVFGGARKSATRNACTMNTHMTYDSKALKSCHIGSSPPLSKQASQIEGLITNPARRLLY